ncbi:MAG: DUF459 domain-containing protein [Salaquimonas sp.]|nr:DUF459 domain-containing protein [Salaquimonas sp.]
MKRLLPILIALALLTGGLPAPVVNLVAGQAHAQQVRKSGPLNLFDLIFGGALRKQHLKRSRSDPRARRVIVRPGSGSGVIAGGQTAPKEVVEKAKNAAKVLVVGDFAADGLEWGLEQAYADNPRVVFVDAAKGLSGLVRDDVQDWPATVPQLIAENNPVAVVVLVGMNDRQLMRLETGTVQKLDDAWKAEYVKRVGAVVKAVRDKGLPLFWVGLLPVSSGSMNKDYLVFNEFYRAAVEAAGGKFIDVWDGFTNADGQFVVAGPDVSGQIVRLRISDGINMTKAGKAKLAYYVERELRKIPGLASNSAVAALPGLDNPARPLAPQYDPATTGRTIVIALDGPMADGGEALEGGENEAKENEELSTSYELVVRGMSALPKKGRIDYVWGAPGGVREKPIAKPQKDAAASPSVPEEILQSTQPIEQSAAQPEVEELPDGLVQEPDGVVSEDGSATDRVAVEAPPARKPLLQRILQSARKGRLSSQIPVNGVGSLPAFTDSPNH